MIERKKEPGKDKERREIELINKNRDFFFRRIFFFFFFECLRLNIHGKKIKGKKWENVTKIQKRQKTRVGVKTRRK